MAAAEHSSTLVEIRPQSPEKAGLVAEAEGRVVADLVRRILASGGSGPPCEWHVVIEDDFEFAIYDVDSLQTQHSATGRWLERWCPGVGAVDVNGFFVVPEGGLVDPYQLALDALASVQITPPAMRTSPSENGRLYVQVPTWLWLDSTWWQTYEATANTGRVWSTVRATPVATTWELGDGQSVSCRGPGTPWRRGFVHPHLPQLVSVAAGWHLQP